MNKAWNVFKPLVKIGVISAYILMIIILVAQALTPGNESSNISNSVGDKINDVVTEIQKPEVTVVNVSEVNITSLTILGKKHEGDNINISMGNTGKINCQVLPSDATNKALTYSSSDESIIYVYSDGRVLAKAVGSATISVYSSENDEIYDTITLTVVEIPLEGIQIGNIPKEIHVGQKQKLEITYTPGNASSRDILWTSSNTKVLTVDASGVITAKSEGEATVTASSKHNPDFVSTIKVQVLPKIEKPVVAVEAVEITTGDSTGRIGDTVKLAAKLLPGGATGKVMWFSSDESIATVSQSGEVSCLKAGSVTITARYDDNIEDSVTVTVKEILTENIIIEIFDIKSTDDGYVLKQGNSGKVVGHLDENATVFDIVFSSSDDSIAKISPDGVIEAIRGGTVMITVSSSYDGETTSESFELTIDPITLKDTVENFYYMIRKSIGHFGAFLVLGIFAAFSYYIIFKKTISGKLIGFAVCLFAGFAVAGITEILQLPYFTAGRYCSFDDVMLDFSGYCTSSIPIYLAIIITHPIAVLIKGKRRVNQRKL